MTFWGPAMSKRAEKSLRSPGRVDLLDQRRV
jgi:hypothetical protein